MIEAGTQFIGIKPEINMQERKSAVANNPTDVFTIEDIAEAVQGLAPYKVYTALLTQIGRDSPLSISEGTLTIGVTYYINDTVIDMDFTNVGAPNNDVGTYFVATGTTPIWGTNPLGLAILFYNEGAPVVTVLENTLGNIWFTYSDTGLYDVQSDQLFDQDRISVFFGGLNSISDSHFVKIYDFNSSYPSSFTIQLQNFKFQNTNDSLFNTPIEIRVYG